MWPRLVAAQLPQQERKRILVRRSGLAGSNTDEVGAAQLASQSIPGRLVELVSTVVTTVGAHNRVVAAGLTLTKCRPLLSRGG